MATLERETAEREIDAGALLLVACVRLDRVAAALSNAAPACADAWLSPGERALAAAAVTTRRRCELVGGRLAAKIVCGVARSTIGLTPLRWPQLDVRRDASGAPICVAADGITHRLSIAHAGGLAVAAATPDDATVGIDVEPVNRHLGPEFLHPIEALQVASHAEALRCWTLREAWAKLTGRGVAADLENVASLRAGPRRLLIVPRGQWQDAHPLLATGIGMRFAIAVALRRAPVD